MIDVLVVGAGPTGLTLAAQLQAHGARVRVIERRRKRRDSRAFVVHPRTLELLAPLGIAAELVERGNPSAVARIHAGSRDISVSLASPAVDDCAFPFLLAIPQATVEEALEAHLSSCGVPVERGIELTSLTQRVGGVDCVLQEPGEGEQPVAAAYVAGCDGADSTVRDQVKIPFPARAYRSAVLLADVTVEGGLDPAVVHGFVGTQGILFLFPWPATSTWRLLTVETGGSDDPVTLERLQSAADCFTGGSLQLGELHWAERVGLRRGQATRYRAGRAVLAGDAAHVHSPAGAQGMNTGIHDACNLGWKLAPVTSGAASPELLESYEAERWPVARFVRRLTDLVFLGEAGDLPMLGPLRKHVAPVLLPLVDDRTIPSWAFRILGGLWINYRGSPWVEDGDQPPGRPLHAGDRLGDGKIISVGRERWLHETLRPPGWHLLACGSGSAAAMAASARHRWPVPLTAHRLVRRPQAGALADPRGNVLPRLGGGEPAIYLIRPDGYIGYRTRGLALDGISRYLVHRVIGGERPWQELAS